jgi:hypothetical protein
MKKTTVLVGMILMVVLATLAKDPPNYDKGLLVGMGSSSCGMAEKGSKTVAGELLGTDGQHKMTQEVLCQEYVLQSDRIVYHIRPSDEKHPVLLPVGEAIEFRIHKDKLYLLNREGDNKEREYSVISMQVRADVKSANNSQ